MSIISRRPQTDLNNTIKTRLAQARLLTTYHPKMAYSTSLGDSIKFQSFPHSTVSVQSIFSPGEGSGEDQIWLGNIHNLPRRVQNQTYSGSPWQHPHYLQHSTQHEKPFVSAGQAPTLHPVNQAGMNAISSFPRATGPRMVSPAPSLELSTPTSSSARSPATDPEWYPDPYYPAQIQDDLSLSSSVSYFTQGLSTPCNERLPLPLLIGSPGFSCVNMSQVQGFADPQEFTEPQEDAFEPDERYLDLDQAEYSIEVDHRPLRADEVRAPYRRSHANNDRPGITEDSGYVRDHTPLPTVTDIEVDPEGDDEVLEDEASDTEYKPRATRASKRRISHSSKPSSSSSVRRGRVAKSMSLKSSRPSKLAPQCRTCKAQFKDATSLQHHIEDSHPRAFTCVFNFAGCESTFASKNEWKRHVSTQHLNFHFWICDLGNCGKDHSSLSTSSPKTGSAGPMIKTATFNRKDLFTQHLRRMHSPPSRKRQDKPNSEWEQTIKGLQKSCLRYRRQPPKSLACPVSDCKSSFEGSNCWDDRMEHVAKHLEKVASAVGLATVQHEKDDLLVSWAVKEGIIKRVDGAYKLITTAPWLDVLDEDADGEDDY